VRFTVITAILGLLAASTVTALAQPGALPPALALYDGRFDGPGGRSSFISIEHGGEGWIRGLDGSLPATCVKDGRTLVAGRDGAVGIDFHFASNRKLLGRNRATPDGRFAFGLRHRPDHSGDPAYAVWIRARFEGPVVRGSMHGVLESSFDGKCRASRSFVARRSR
jgi:hypothetical protein